MTSTSNRDNEALSAVRVSSSESVPARQKQELLRSKNGPSYTIAIPDHLVDEELLRWRLAKIFEMDEEQVSLTWTKNDGGSSQPAEDCRVVTVTWRNGRYTICNAPVKRLRRVGLRADMNVHMIDCVTGAI